MRAFLCPVNTANVTGSGWPCNCDQLCRRAPRLQVKRVCTNLPGIRLLKVPPCFIINGLVF